MTSSRKSSAKRKVFAARFEDWSHKWRMKIARKRGKIPSIIPYIGYGSTEWVRILARVLYLKKKNTSDQSQRNYVVQVSKVRGWRTFTSVPVADAEVDVFIDGKRVGSAVSDRGGVIDSVIDVQLTPGWHTVSLVIDGSVPTETPVFIVAPEATFGVISDVDDTILQTALPKPFVAAWNTFVVDEQARAATPGMPVLLQRLVNEHPGTPIVYLSTGAWNAAPALSRFMSRNLYPVGPLLLTDWGPTHDRFFRSGKEHKRAELRRIISEFPNIRWVLIGDDGQKDEMLYHEFSVQHPEHVAAVAIRQLSTGEAVLSGGRSKARLHGTVSGVPWVYGPDGATLKDELLKLGVL